MVYHLFLLPLASRVDNISNFITYNAYSCIELNSHSFILLLLIMRDQIPNGNNHFLPWLLGSQACEQIFRAARSMTLTFSTLINFSTLRRFLTLSTSFTDSDDARIRSTRNWNKILQSYCTRKESGIRKDEGDNRFKVEI